MTEDDVEILEKQTVFQGYFHIDRYQLRFRRFDGSWSQKVSREVFERGHAVALLLYDPARAAVGLIEQFRPGALAAGLPPWLIEIPAGIIDAGQTPLEAAIREAKEETGLAIDAPRSIARILMSPGGTSETIEIFLALIDSTELDGIHGVAGENEDIRVFALALDEAIAWVDSGRICNAITVIALQWLALHRHSLT